VNELLLDAKDVLVTFGEEVFLLLELHLEVLNLSVAFADHANQVSLLFLFLLDCLIGLCLGRLHLVHLVNLEVSRGRSKVDDNSIRLPFALFAVFASLLSLA